MMICAEPKMECLLLFSSWRSIGRCDLLHVGRISCFFFAIVILLVSDIVVSVVRWTVV